MLSDTNSSVPKFRIVKIEKVSEDSHTELVSDCLAVPNQYQIKV